MLSEKNNSKRKASILARKTSGANYPHSLLKQSISPAYSRSSSVSSLSFSSSEEIRSTTKGKTAMAILAEEMAKLTQSLDEIAINRGTSEDFLNDEQHQTQTKKIKSLIEQLQKSSVFNQQDNTFLSPPNRFITKHPNWIDTQIEQFSDTHFISDSHLSSRSKGTTAKSSRLPEKKNVKLLPLSEIKHKKETPVTEKHISEEKLPYLRQTLQFSPSELPSEAITTNPVNRQQEISIRMLTPNKSLAEEQKYKMNRVNILELEPLKPSTTEEDVQDDLKPPETNKTADVLSSVTVKAEPASFSNASIPSKQMVSPPTGIQAFVFNNKKPKLEIRHPGPAFLKNYLVYLSQQSNLHSPITLSSLLKIITQSYMAKSHAMRETSRNRALPLSAVLYDLLHKKYGLKTVAEQKMKHVILGCLAFSARSTRIKGFGRFLGISEECSVGDFNFYIECMDFTIYNIPKSLLPNDTVLGEQSVLYERLVLFIEFYFKTKLTSEEYSGLSRELHELKILHNQVAIDLDKGFSIMLRYFQRIVMRVSSYLQTTTGNSWEENKLFTYDEFLSVILQLEDIPEGMLNRYFSIYKENSEITKREVIAVEPLLLFVIDNSLLDFLKAVQS